MLVARRNTLVMISLVLVFLAGAAVAKKNPVKSQVVDAGSFGIFVDGKRVATETFQIQQQGEGSIAVSELKAQEDGSGAKQRAELQLASNGNLRRYEWRELSPGKALEMVEPAEQFLVEHITPNLPEKPQDQTFLLPVSTVVLDDYFFSHRQILAWRYFAESCGGTITPACKLTKTQYGALIPRQRTSATVTLEYIGPEQVVVRGAERTLSRVNMTTDGDLWTLFVDENLKVLRIVIAGQNTEIVRD
jgi:hypothetical protein